MSATPAAPGGRMPLLDAVKGLACLLIVAHHITRYGPLPAVALPLAPGLIGWLSNDGRLAVQVFLVVGGFLAAASLAPDGLLREPRPATRLAQRYVRLVMPYLAALCCGVVAAALVRPWLHDEMVPAPPTLLQLVAHGLLLQDLLGQEALSTGVWYVAIDFQLFALALSALSLARLLQRRWHWSAQRAGGASMALVLLLAGASLAVFNRHTAWDVTGLYFFGAYGLGMLSFWVGRLRRSGAWLAGVAVLLLFGSVALQIEWRVRIAIALATALGLALSQRAHGLEHPGLSAGLAPLLWLGRISYSLFLVHFPVILLISALVSQLRPAVPWIYALGMLAALGLSIGAAALLCRFVESRPASWRGVLGLFSGLLVCGTLAALW